MALQLIIEHGPRRNPPAPAGEVWRDPQGVTRGFVYSLDHRDCVYLPGLALFEFGREGDDVRAFPEGRNQAERIEEAFYRCVLPMALQARGCEVLHSSAVQVSSGGVVGFCGLARSGKSTLAFGLSRRGYPLWANDALVFGRSAGRVEALPVPFSVRLRSDSETFFGESSDASRWIDQRRREGAPLVSLCVLNRIRGETAARIDVRRLSPAAAFRQVLAHACCFMTEEAARKRRTMVHYLDLVARVPVFEISYATGFQHFPELLDVVEEVMAAREPLFEPVRLGSPFVPRPAGLPSRDRMTVV